MYKLTFYRPHVAISAMAIYNGYIHIFVFVGVSFFHRGDILTVIGGNISIEKSDCRGVITIPWGRISILHRFTSYILVESHRLA